MTQGAEMLAEELSAIVLRAPNGHQLAGGIAHEEAIPTGSVRFEAQGKKWPLHRHQRGHTPAVKDLMVWKPSLS